MESVVEAKIGSWDLNDLVRHPDGDEFKEFLETINKMITEFESRKDHLNDQISSKTFQNILYIIEDIMEKVSIVTGYARLRYAADTSSNEAASLVTTMDMLEADIANRMLFFDIWFKK